MKLLENRILRDGRVTADGVLTADGFLGDMIDVSFAAELAAELCKRFENAGATKVLCASLQSAVALFSALTLDLPLVSAQRSGAPLSDRDAYIGRVVSYTRSEVYDLSVPRKFLSRSDKVLIVTDFISRANETLGLVDIVEQAGAAICGVGCAIEKSYLPGAKVLADKGIRVESLVRIESMSASNGVRFIAQ